MGRSPEAGAPRDRKVAFRLSGVEGQMMDKARGDKPVSTYMRDLLRDDWESKGVR